MINLIRTYRNGFKNWILWKLGYVKQFNHVVLPFLKMAQEQAEKGDIIIISNDPLTEDAIKVHLHL